MKILLFTALLSTICYWVGAQNPGDSVWVNSFDYSMTYGSGERDTVLNFPTTAANGFEKILMYYSMRCKNGLVSPPVSGQTNIGCGEWDYSCNTYIVDSSRADSIARSTKSHKIAGFTGATFEYIPNPTIDFHKKYLNTVVMNSVVSETQANVSPNVLPNNSAFPLQHYNAKSQYLYTAAELQAAGLTGAGNIDGMFLFPINTISAKLGKIKIKHAASGQTSLSQPEFGGWTVVHNDDIAAYAFPQGHRLMFNTPFTWDGTSDIIVEFSYTSTTGNGGFTIPYIKGHSTSFPSAVYSSGEQAPYFNGTNYVQINGYKGVSGSDNRTVEAWIRSTASNNEIFSWGTNSTGNKWVVRINGNGTLRAEAAGGYIYGTTNIADGEWHHVACVLDGSGIQNVKLYVDGALESNGGMQNVAINTSGSNGSDVSIGHGHNNTYFIGNIDNVRIWNTALAASEIMDWMHMDITSGHPNFANLQLDLHKDSLDASGATWEDASTHARDGSVIGGLWMERHMGEDILKDFQVANARPDLGFLRGTYNLTTTLDSTWFQMPRNPSTVSYLNLIDNSGTIMSDELNYDSVVYLWDVTDGYVYYDTSGNQVNTSPIAPWGTITVTDTPYWYRSPMALEIMSFVTPYGINLDLGIEGKTWIFDVTDFAPILNGDKRLIMNKGGQWQEDMDIKFLFVYGTPPRDVLDITNIWHSNRQVNYNDISTDNVFPPRGIMLPPSAAAYKVRSSITGHGAEGEFIPRDHELTMTGSVLNSWQVWKTCGSNPVYPQGGTWIYDRAGWCPGMATNIVETEIPISGSSNYTLDYHMPIASGDSRYIVSHEVVSYGDANFNLDARITDIVSPSDYVEHAKMNPSCAGPQIIIQNSGSSTLNSAKIEYWVNNSSQKSSFTWNGTLEFMESAVVDLPASVDLYSPIDKNTGNIFHAELIEVNGQTDENNFNNSLQSKFDVPRVYPSDLVLMINTNKAPSETEYRITDASGNILFSKIHTEVSSLVFDTVSGIGTGCYTLEVIDSDGDGTDFWANNDGTGTLRVLSQSNGVLETLDGDFGNELVINFTVDWPLSYEKLQQLWDVLVFPNPTNDHIKILAKNIQSTEVQIVNSLGQVMTLQPINSTTELLELNVENWVPGVYTILLKNGDKQAVEKFVKQ